MKAILTKRLPHTLTKPSRIKAYDLDGNNVVVSTHDPEIELLNEEEKHREAARQLALKMNWLGRWGGYEYYLVGGATKEGYAWVFV